MQRRTHIVILEIAWIASISLLYQCSSNTGIDKCGNGYLDPGEECDFAQNSTEECGLTCGTTGIRYCTSACEWGECVGVESCITPFDDDCNGETGFYMLDEPPVKFGDFELMEVIYSSDNYCALEKNGTTLSALLVDEAGSVCFGPQLVSSYFDLTENPVSLITSDNGYIAIWVDSEERILDEGYDVIGGVELNEECDIVSDVAYTGGVSSSVRRLSLIYNEGGATAFWQEGDNINYSYYSLSDNEFQEVSVLSEVLWPIGSPIIKHNDFLAYVGYNGVINVNMYNADNELAYPATIFDSENALSQMELVSLGAIFAIGWSRIESALGPDTEAMITLLSLSDTIMQHTVQVSENDVTSGPPEIAMVNNETIVSYLTREVEDVSDEVGYKQYTARVDLNIAKLDIDGATVGDEISIELGNEVWRELELTGELQYLYRIFVRKLFYDESGITIFYYIQNSTAWESYFRRISCVEG